MARRRCHAREWSGLIGVAAIAACGGGVDVDDYGPPAGYAVLAGAVRQPGGTGAAGIEVTFTRCATQVGGFLAAATTDAAGRFRAEAHLPPRGVLPRGITDTLALRCYVFLDRSGVVRDSVSIRFAPTREAAPVTTVDLMLPPPAG